MKLCITCPSAFIRFISLVLPPARITEKELSINIVRLAVWPKRHVVGSKEPHHRLSVKLKGDDLVAPYTCSAIEIPNEMGDKGRESIKIWAESNSRLAALYKRRNQPEVAVPLLVEIIRLMSPTSAKGKKAYKDLLQLGFVETPYRGL